MNNKIKCLECEKLFIRPLSHVWQVHGLSAREYKELHGLDVKKGIATEEYKDRMRAHVMSNGTLDNLKRGAVHRFKAGVSRPYTRSKETMERLKVHFSKVRSNKGMPVTVLKIKIQCALCGKEKFIYPRYFKEGNNYCGVVCRNRSNNIKNK